MENRRAARSTHQMASSQPRPLTPRQIAWRQMTEEIARRRRETMYRDKYLQLQGRGWPGVLVEEYATEWALRDGIALMAALHYYVGQVGDGTGNSISGAAVGFFLAGPLGAAVTGSRRRLTATFRRGW